MARSKHLANWHIAVDRILECDKLQQEVQKKSACLRLSRLDSATRSLKANSYLQAYNDKLTTHFELEKQCLDSKQASEQSQWIRMPLQELNQGLTETGIGLEVTEIALGMDQRGKAL